MKKAIIIYSENEEKLKFILNLIDEKLDRGNININIYCNGYFPSTSSEIVKKISFFYKYSVFPSDKKGPASIVELLLKIKEDDVLLVDENSIDLNLLNWDLINLGQVYCTRNELLQLNLDTKYETVKWFFADILSQKFSIEFEIDSSIDSIRYLNKIKSPLFREKIIYVDGGLGDHIMALPLLEKLSNTIYVSCKYHFVYDHLSIKGLIPWNDELFGGYDRFVYQYGSINNSKTIIDAFFEMYGYKRENTDILKYNGKRESDHEINIDQKIALICTSAAKIQDMASNKDWRDIRWFKLVHELKKKGYFVIQVGTSKDNQIPNVNFKFLDRSIAKLAWLIDNSSLWLSVDTFFHHFASAIKPKVGICLTPFYNDHAKHTGVTYIEKDCEKNFFDRRWWLDLQQPERKECMDLITIENILEKI